MATSRPPARLDGQGRERHVDFVTDDVVGAVGMVPVLLGTGRPLFSGHHPRLDLRLVDYAVQDGKVRLVYARR